MALFSGDRRALTYPGSRRRVLRRPDLRGLGTPLLSAAPLSGEEIDYDDLIVHRSWRSYDPEKPGEVRYFMYELSQRNPGEELYTSFFKAVRLIRLTRVPRYLRHNTGHAGGPGAVFEQMRDVLTALREQQCLFVNMIAKSPEIPLVFAYGVQTIGATPEEAQIKADEAYAVLDFQLSGTYQQLEYKAITLQEGELLSRYQAQWDHIAMARGRPMPVGETLGAAAMFDGNRSQTEMTNNQLESFIRAMASSERRGFMLNLVTVPLSPDQIAFAWKNLARRVSDVRSDQEGTRGFTAGVAVPFSMASSLGASAGSAHSAGQSVGQGAAQGTSTGHALGSSLSHADTASLSHADTASASHGTSQSVTDAVNHQVGTSQSATNAVNVGQSAGTSHGTNQALATGVSSQTGVAQSTTHGASETASHGVSAADSLSNSVTQGQNWGQSASHSIGASTGRTDGLSQSSATSLQQMLSLTNTKGDSLTGTATAGSGTSAHGGILGFGGSGNTQKSSSDAQGISNSNALGTSLSGGTSQTAGVSSSVNQGTNEGLTAGQNVGGSAAQSLAASHQVGTSTSLSAGQSVAASSQVSQAAGTSQSLSAGVNSGVNAAVSSGAAHASTAGVSDAAGTSHGVSSGVNDTVGKSATDTVGKSATDTVGKSVTDSTGTNNQLSQQQAVSDATMSTLTRTTAMTGGLGVVPSVAAVVTRVTRDLAKQSLGDVLEAQLRRYHDGIDGAGAFLYQMFLVCEDRETLVGAAGLLKSAFWGPGGETARVGAPFHVITSFGEGTKGDAETSRLLSHFRAWTSYRRREPSMELIEPFMYSSYITPGEMAAFCHPPTGEAPGLLAVHDSMPVMAMPADRNRRELRIGRIINGERGRVDECFWGLDADELTHTLITGVTGSGKTTTLMTLLSELARVERAVTPAGTIANPNPTPKALRASILGLDWMPNMRQLASVVEPVTYDENGTRHGRFQFFSVTRPDLGAFRWNPLAVPDEKMNPQDWMNTQADNFTASMGLGEFGRSLIAEFLDVLYRANRLEETILMPARSDEDGTLVRPAFTLEAIDEATLPEDAIREDANGVRYANCFTCPALTRLVGMEHLAVLCAAKVEECATPEGARLHGQAMRDRIQSLWRRLSYYAPGGQFSDLICADPSLDERRALTIHDLIDPDAGLVTILETENLDVPNRRLLLGSVLLAIYRYGLHHGIGVFDQEGAGPGLFIVLEEAHELFGEKSGEGDDEKFSTASRVALYEQMHRRIRALGARFIDVVQNPGAIPAAITSNTSTVFVHRTYDDADRKRVFSLLNWSQQINQQPREWRYLGEMPIGYCIVRRNAKESYLESAPVQILTEPAVLATIDDERLKSLAALRG